MSPTTMQIIQLVLIVVAANLNLSSASSWLCIDCKGKPACEKACSQQGLTSATITTTTTTTTQPPTTFKTSTKWRLKTKPAWWRPLPCKICFGWVARRNATIRNICRYGCGNGQPGYTKPTIAAATTTTTKATTLTTTRQPSTATSLPSSTTFNIRETTLTKTKLHETTRAFRNQQQKLSVRLSTATRHTNYIWFLIGIVGFGFLMASFFVIRKYTSVKQRVGVIDIQAQEVAEIVHISRPFTFP